MPSGDIWKVDLVTSQQGVNAVNVWYWKQVGDVVTGSEEFNVNRAVELEIVPIYAAWASNRLTFLGARIQKWVPKAILPVIFPYTGQSGSVDADPIASTKAALMSVYTNNASPTGRGRSYFMGVPETSQTGGNWTPIQFSGFFNMVNKFNAPIQVSGDAASYVHGVFSNKDNAFYDEMLTVGNPRIFQQRSRQAVGL